MILRIPFILFLVGSGLSGFASENIAILGEWYTTDKTAKVMIYECGSSLCGKVSWLEDPNGDDGKPLKDTNNPEEKLQSRPVMGLDILHGFKRTEDNKWEGGKIYDPENGKTYKCKMTLEEGVLNVRGFIGFSLLGRTERWTRAN